VLELKETNPEEQPQTEDGQEVAEPVVEDTTDPGDKELIIDEEGSNELDFDRLEALSKDWEDHFNEEHRRSRTGLDEEGDKRHDAMQNMASRPQSLQEYLNDQVAFLDTTPDQAKLVHFVISHIDENGRLATPLEDIARTYERPVSVGEV